MVRGKKREILSRPEGGVEEAEAADVEPPAADDGEGEDLGHQQQRHLHHHVAQAQRARRPPEAEEGGGGVEEREADPDHAVAGHGDQQAGEVDARHARLHLQAHHGEVADVVGAEGEHQDEERVEGDHPEDVLEEDEGAVEAEEALPGELLGRPVPLHRVPLAALPTHLRLFVNMQK